MDRLNEAVIEHLEKRLLDPAWLEILMDQRLDRREESVAERRQHVAELERRATETEPKLARLYEAIENRLVDTGVTASENDEAGFQLLGVDHEGHRPLLSVQELCRPKQRGSLISFDPRRTCAGDKSQ